MTTILRPPPLLTRGPLDLAAHRHRFGPLPGHTGDSARRTLLAEIEAAGLLGHGGGGFPTARKMRAVAGSGRRSVVLANGCESEPLSGKDAALLQRAPHLVLDGLALAAAVVGAGRTLLCLHTGAAAGHAVRRALAERGEHVELVAVPRRYTASEETALVNLVNTGNAVPTGAPPRPSERGVDGRPTLVLNVETLAHIALIARFGADAYRASGTPAAPGPMLVTASGAVRFPGVYQLPAGAPLGSALRAAGGTTGPVHAALVGGYAGGWVSVVDSASVPLAHRELAAVGSALGVAAVHALPAGACGLAETARILRYLAEQSAGQCGPCVFGLPAIAADLAALADGRDPAAALQRLRRRSGLLPGRGGCAHPGGAARLAASALRVFAADVTAHIEDRRCAAGLAEHDRGAA